MTTFDPLELWEKYSKKLQKPGMLCSYPIKDTLNRGVIGDSKIGADHRFFPQ
jgi:hypothetical protein